jgi:dTDP-4-amino-4,6-dideoxygalactose transaminase
MKIPITKPLFGEEEKKAILESLESGWVVQGPRVAEFEALFAEFTGAKYAVATTSCTTALHLSLIALGVGSGDEVILPSFTFVATANAVEYTGATPVFCDIDLDTFNIDVDRIRERITGKTKAIIPVHLFGLSADMKPIMEIAEQHGLKVIEDAACGFGSSYHGKHVGTFGHAGCFSFHPRKAITTGEGGMIATENRGLMVKLRSLRDHGASKSDLNRHVDRGGSLLPDFDQLGYNYRLTDIQGALGTAQMKAAGRIIAARRARAERYDLMLKSENRLKSPECPGGSSHSYQSYVCLFKPKDHPLEPEGLSMERVSVLNEKRNELMDRLADRGIATRQGTHAVHSLGYYRRKYNLRPEDYMKSFAAERLSLTLPLYVQMTDEEQDFVIRELKECAELLGY